MKLSAEKALQLLLTASKEMMHIITSEDEESWRRSQAYEEAPYHFLWVAIRNAENSTRKSN